MSHLDSKHLAFPSPIKWRKAVLHTVGHLDRYRTHELKLKGVEPARRREEKRKEGSCGCPYLAPIEEFQMRWQDEDFFRELQKTEAARRQSGGARRQTVYDDSSMKNDHASAL